MKFYKIILFLMIIYDFSLHICDIFKIDPIWGPGRFFQDFSWGSVSYNYFWAIYWGIATILVLILLFKKDKGLDYYSKAIKEGVE